MKIIALTGSDLDALHAVHTRILQVAAKRETQILVIEGVDTALDAQVVYAEHGELWRVGFDESRPELDPLIDRWINKEGGLQLAQVDHCIAEFLGKQVIA